MIQTILKTVEMNHRVNIPVSLYLITEGTQMSNPNKSCEGCQMAHLGKARI